MHHKFKFKKNKLAKKKLEQTSRNNTSIHNAIDALDLIANYRAADKN
jgi:hypothetical protein